MWHDLSNRDSPFLMAAVNSGATMNLTRRRVLHLAAGAPALPFVSSLARAENYPIAAGAYHRRISTGRSDRYRRTPDGAVAVGAARSAICHREPAWRRQQHRHRGGRARARGRLYAACWPIRRTRSTRRSTTSSISISSATSRRSRASAARPPSWWSIHRFPPRRFPSLLPSPRPIRARSILRSGGHGTPPHVVGELFKMMAGVN